MANPILSQARRGGGFSPYAYGADRGLQRITLDDVLMKTIMQLAVLLPVAVATFVLLPPAIMGLAAIGSALAAFVLCLVISFMQNPPKVLIFLYAILEGVMVGGLSKAYGMMFDGIVFTAILATTVAAVTVILGVKMGFLRTSPKVRKILFYAFLGYAAFCLVSIVLSLVGIPVLVLGSPLALGVSIIGTGLAVFSLVMDVEDVQAAVQAGVDEGASWKLSFGLVASLVWLYIEILRLLANINALMND